MVSGWLAVELSPIVTRGTWDYRENDILDDGFDFQMRSGESAMLIRALNGNEIGDLATGRTVRPHCLLILRIRRRGTWIPSSVRKTCFCRLQSEM